MSAMTKINDTYYFRLRVPKDVKEYFPRPVIVKSTHTKKYIHAKSLVRVMLGKLEDVFMTIRSKVLDDAACQYVIFKKTGADINAQRGKQTLSPLCFITY
jgi:hypothetical protein